MDWDDRDNFLENPHYRGLGWSHLRWMWTTFHMGHYIPVTWMTFGLDYLLWGMQPFGYHLTNLLLHATNAALFYFVAFRLLGLALPSLADQRKLALAVSAAVASLLFALHPLRVESVAWATERRDVLCGLFYLLAILLYLRAWERGERGRRWYWLSVAAFACALLSKSMAVSLPVVLLILDVYPLRRFREINRWWDSQARRIYLEKVPFVALAVATSAIAFVALFRVNNMAPVDRLTVPGRLAVAAYGLSFYLWKLIVPVNLSPLYTLPAKVNPWAPRFLVSFGAVLAIAGVAWTLRRRVPGLAAAWLAYVVILLPVLGLFQNGAQIAADRYTYLAGLSWATLAAAGLGSCWRRWPAVASATALLILLGLGTVTWRQVQLWHDSEKLWTHARTVDPESSVAQNNVGVALSYSGRVAEAAEHYQRAVTISPDYASAHYNLGLTLALQSKHADAIEHYRQAVLRNPNHAKAHIHWGIALARQGKLDEAIEHYQQALRLTPEQGDAHFNWGVALARQGRPAEAIEHYVHALRLNPDNASAQANLLKAVLSLEMGKDGSARGHQPENSITIGRARHVRALVVRGCITLGGSDSVPLFVSRATYAAAPGIIPRCARHRSAPAGTRT